MSRLENTSQPDITFVQPVRDTIEDLPRHAVPRNADHLGPRVLSRARVTCHVSRSRVTCCVTRHLQEVDVAAVHHDQAPAPGPGRVLQPRVLGRGHAQPHQGVRGARGGGLHLIVSTKFRSNIYVILRSFKDFYNPKKWQTVFKYCHNTLTYIHK